MKQSATEIIEKGMQWIAGNQDAWKTLKGMVGGDVWLYDGASDLRIAYYAERLRHEMRVHVPNSILPYLARRLEREIEGAKFTKSNSKVDLLIGRDGK